MPLILTNKLFKSPSGLIFECSGIVRDVPIKINETEVHLDFHIYAILEFNLLIGYPLENLFQEKPSHEILNKEFGKIASTTYLEIPMVEHHTSHDQFEEVKFISPFISHPCEIERSSSPSLESKLCPSSHENVVLNGGRDSTMILHDISLENKNFYAMDKLFSTSCSYEDSNHLLILVSKTFMRMVMDAYVYQKYCRSRESTIVLTL